MFKFTWKIRNWLNQKKKQISNFFDFYFSSYVHFCTQNDPNFRWIFLHNSKKKKMVSFFTLFSTFRISYESLITSEGRGGVCISLVGKKPKNSHNSNKKKEKSKENLIFLPIQHIPHLHVNLSTFEKIW